MQTDEERHDAMETRSASGIIILAGIWLIISPFILSYDSSAVTWNQVVFGVIIGILGIIRYMNLAAMWASWLSALAGLWMVIAPFVIGGATTAARWSSVITGLITLVLSLGIVNQRERLHMPHHTHPAM
jgi:hypothetical protein